MRANVQFDCSMNAIDACMFYPLESIAYANATRFHYLLYMAEMCAATSIQIATRRAQTHYTPHAQRTVRNDRLTSVAPINMVINKYSSV